MRHLVYIFLFIAMPAWAQLYPLSSNEITPEQAQTLFKDLKKENSKMDEHSECFERAHMWALRAEKVHKVTMEKVYLYFTYKFQMKHRVTTRWGRSITWWFHVAPAVRVNGELWVMDATFTDRAMPLQDWAGSLMKDPEVCMEINDPMEYVEERNASEGYRHVDRVRNQCYYTAAPRFFYQPLEIGYRESTGGGMIFSAPTFVPTVWNPATWNWALPSYNRSERKAARQAMGF